MLHDAKARHRQPGLQLLQRAAVTLKKEVQENATRWISECLEYEIVVRHGQTIGDYMVTCQETGQEMARFKNAGVPR